MLLRNYDEICEINHRKIIKLAFKNLKITGVLRQAKITPDSMKCGRI